MARNFVIFQNPMLSPQQLLLGNLHVHPGPYTPQGLRTLLFFVGALPPVESQPLTSRTIWSLTWNRTNEGCPSSRDGDQRAGRSMCTARQGMAGEVEMGISHPPGGAVGLYVPRTSTKQRRRTRSPLLIVLLDFVGRAMQYSGGFYFGNAPPFCSESFFLAQVAAEDIFILECDR